MSFLRRAIPKGLREAVGTARFYGWNEYLRLILLGRRYRNRYRDLCPPLDPDQFFVPPDMTFRIDPRARGSFDLHTVVEPQVIDEMDCFIKMTRQSRCLIDAGAEYGLFSLVFTKRPGSRAYAIDPSPGTVPVLLENIRLNPELQIEAINAAVGESSGTLRMTFDSIMMHAADTQSAAPGAGVREVPMVTIDGFVAERNLTPDALKIDVEGYELSVLRGAAETLARFRPTLFLEVHPQYLTATGATTGELFAWLKDRRYRFVSCRMRPLDDPARWTGSRIRRLVCVAQ